VYPSNYTADMGDLSHFRAPLRIGRESTSAGKLDDLDCGMLGFSGETWTRMNTAGFYFAVPFWFVAIIAALAPLGRLIHLSRRVRNSANLCARCGYDLRATPDRCPECGSATAMASAKANGSAGRVGGQSRSSIRREAACGGEAMPGGCTCDTGCP
jgi:hypothetical protein